MPGAAQQTDPPAADHAPAAGPGHAPTPVRYRVVTEFSFLICADPPFFLVFLFFWLPLGSVFPKLKQKNRVLPSFTEFYLFLPSFFSLTEFNRVYQVRYQFLPGFTEFDLVLPNFT